VRLVGDIERHLAELLFVSPCMVCAEKKLASAWHHRAQERLGATTVTAVSNAQSGCIWGNSSVHMSLISVLVTFST
jgi:hypothetical protein